MATAAESSNVVFVKWSPEPPTRLARVILAPPGLISVRTRSLSRVWLLLSLTLTSTRFPAKPEIVLLDVIVPELGIDLGTLVELNVLLTTGSNTLLLFRSL